MKRRALVCSVAITVAMAMMAGAGGLPPVNDNDEVLGRLIVEFSEDLSSISVTNASGIALIGDPGLDALAQRFGVYNMRRVFPDLLNQSSSPLDLSRFYLLEFPPDKDLHTAFAAYQANPRVLRVEMDGMRQLDYTPNDPLFTSQWAMLQVDAPLAYDFCRGSENVIIGIVDNGTDTAHVDLRDNIWINPGEDLNGNGIIEASEWNGVDNDGNGYVDDFWGWNTLENNNMVMGPYWDDHGTHCAGDASAVTDNGVGVGSLGYSAKIMTVRAGSGGTINIFSAVNGINYCAANGANVISMSYGGSSFLTFENNAIQAAWNAGVALFASAGNQNSSAPHYPSAYANVVSVASTNSNDQKSWFSNYGTTIDVCAPGEGIMNTTPGNGYQSWDGTSFSSPITAGLGALIKAARPEFTNAQIVQRIFATCVNIDALNPGYAGMLGHGRIDAGAAISSLFPILEFSDITFDDAAGNGDGRPDPGETVDLRVTVTNSSTVVNATNVVVTLTCADPAIIINDATSSLGTIPMGSSQNNNADLLVFAVATNAQPHEVDFTLTITEATLLNPVVTVVTQMVGRPDVLIVDDDGGANYQQWYDQDLDTLGVAHDLWDVNASGEIPAAEMTMYPIVMWHTSQVDNPLSVAEQALIQDFVTAGGAMQGGKLFLVGEDIDEQLAGTAFYSNVLRCTSLGTAGAPQLTGIAGDPISSGTSLLLLGFGGAANSLSPSCITPLATADTVYTYNLTGLGGGIRWSDSGGMLVYFAFNFESASGLGGTSLRSVVLDNLLTWFGTTTGGATITLTPYGTPIEIPPGGGIFSYNIAIANTGSTTLNVDVWCDVTLPSGSNYGPTLGPVAVTMVPGFSLARNRNQSVPAAAPAGDYTYNGYIGDYSGVILDEDNFPFTKLAAGDGGAGVAQWTNSGQPLDGWNNGIIIATAPDEYALRQNYPNPFNPETEIRFALPASGTVRLTVYDLTGKLVSVLVNQEMPAGEYHVPFRAEGLSSGVYLYRLQAGDYDVSRKMVLIR